MIKTWFTWLLLSLVTLTTILSLAIPVAGDGVLVHEKRKVTDFPDWPKKFKRGEVQKFSNTVEMYFMDRIVLRDQWLDLASLFPKQADHTKYVEGLDDWLYLGNMHNHCLDQLIGTLVDAPKVVEAKAASYASIQNALASRGIEFHMMIGPDKTSIYPEYLPRTLKPAKTRYIEPILAAMKRNKVNVYDPTPMLLAHKKGGELLYWRTDSHWNQKGSLLATDEFLRISGLPGLAPYTLKMGGPYKGDLIDYCGFQDYPVTVGDNYEIVWDEENASQKSDLKILLIGDSFSGLPLSFLPRVFPKLTYIHYNDIRKQMGLPLPQAVPAYIDTLPTKPDVVLWIQVERSFDEVQ